MSSIFKLLFIVITIVIPINSAINDIMPCYNGLTNIIPINISNYNSSSFFRMNMIFTEENKINNDFQIKLNNYGIRITGKLADIYLDLNTNFSQGDRNVVVSYQCNEILIISPSVNKFWLMTMNFEIHLKCIIKDKDVVYLDFDFLPILNIVIPVSNISRPTVSLSLLESSEYSSNKFLESLADNLRSYSYISESKESFNEKNFKFKFEDKIEMSLFENEYYENNEFFLFNSDNPFDCSSNDSYIFLNRYILVNNNDYRVINDFMNFFKVNLQIDIQNIVYNQNDNLKIYRNFEVVDVRDQYEQLIISMISHFLDINYLLFILIVII